MKITLILLSVVFSLGACTTVPVVEQPINIDTRLLEKCPNFPKLTDSSDMQVLEFIKQATSVYGTCSDAKDKITEILIKKSGM